MNWFKKNTTRPASSGGQTNGQQPSNQQILQTINQMQRELDRLKMAITNGADEPSMAQSSDEIVEQALDEIKGKKGAVQKSETEKTVEGVFDGESMIGADGERYDVPANYASKSKLVEGDLLKLTINNLGAFMYKQIKPIERSRKVGEIQQDDQNLQFYAVSEGKKWRLLTASVTYYKGDHGDEVVFLVPADGGSRWAAVENIVKK